MPLPSIVSYNPLHMLWTSPIEHHRPFRCQWLQEIHGHLVQLDASLIVHANQQQSHSLTKKMNIDIHIQPD